MAASAHDLSARDETRHNIPTNVRALMAFRDVSRTDLMVATGLSKPSLSERLSGATPFKDYELLTIARLFGVPVGLLFAAPDELVGGLSSTKWNTRGDGEANHLAPLPDPAGPYQLALDDLLAPAAELRMVLN